MLKLYFKLILLFIFVASCTKSVPGPVTSDFCINYIPFSFDEKDIVNIDKKQKHMNNIRTFEELCS